MSAPAHRHLVIAVLATAALLLTGGEARAVDTLETFEVGATDLDFYQGFDGIGRQKGERSVFGELMLGYGLVDGLSAYLGASLEGNDQLARGAASLYLGIYGTPLDTDHVDLDVLMDVSSGGEGFRELQITPGMELNFDLVPDLALWGIFMRAGLPLHSRETAPAAGGAEARHELVVPLEVSLGTYFTPREGHQLLLEADAVFHADPAAGEEAVDVGGVALGYNACLSRDCAIELVNQVYLDVPQGAEPLAMGVMTGFVATLPGARY